MVEASSSALPEGWKCVERMRSAPLGETIGEAIGQRAGLSAEGPAAEAAAASGRRGRQPAETAEAAAGAAGRPCEPLVPTWPLAASFLAAVPVVSRKNSE